MPLCSALTVSASKERILLMRTKNMSNIVFQLKKHKYAYIMMIPVLLFYIIFHYLPMFGIIIAFKDYTPIKGFISSEWVGFKHFITFFQNIFFWRLVKNTFLISFLDLLINFPTPIILALLFNELRNKYFKSIVTTVSYFPHFISMVVMCGMIRSFTMSDGIITNLFVMLGMPRESMLLNAALFKSIYVLSSSWKNIGWSSIIYMAALCSVDMQLYEACKIDGGGRWRQMIHVTLPGIAPTIILLFILRIGTLLAVGSEKIILLYNSAIYETADVISSYIFRKGLQEQNWSYGSAVGIFNSLINFIFIVSANYISRQVGETSLW